MIIHKPPAMSTYHTAHSTEAAVKKKQEEAVVETEEKVVGAGT